MTSLSRTRKRVIITGASSGIGRATALRFAAEGWDIGVTARREAALAALLAELPAGDHFLAAGDYSDPATAAAIAAQGTKKWGRLDALVNCAGIYYAGHTVDAPLADFRRSLDIMLDGAIHMTRMAVPLMTGQPASGGRIIHVTSIHGERAEPLSSGYAMAKAAINQYCRGLALELADRGILVNAIAPGFVRTPMSIINGVSELDTDWFRQNYVEGGHLPLRRPAEPEEIAGVAFFLAGPDASYITGQVLTVDGGLTITF